MRALASRRVELCPQLPRRPEVIVVEKCEPVASCIGHTGVVRSCQALPGLVSNDPYASIVHFGQPGWGLVARRVVDDDHFEIDVLLAEGAGKSVSRQKPPAVAGSDHDRDLGRSRH